MAWLMAFSMCQSAEVTTTSVPFSSLFMSLTLPKAMMPFSRAASTTPARSA